MARQQTLALDGAECQDKRWFQVHREDQQKIVEILARLLAQAVRQTTGKENRNDGRND